MCPFLLNLDHHHHLHRLLILVMDVSISFIDSFFFIRTQNQELEKQIDDYTITYDPEDQLEWKLVLDEIRSFIEADNVLAVISMNKMPLILSHRMTPLNVPPMEKVMPSHLVLQEILIVGNCSDQVFIIDNHHKHIINFFFWSLSIQG